MFELNIYLQLPWLCQVNTLIKIILYIIYKSTAIEICRTMAYFSNKKKDIIFYQYPDAMLFLGSIDPCPKRDCYSSVLHYIYVLDTLHYFTIYVHKKVIWTEGKKKLKKIILYYYYYFTLENWFSNKKIILFDLNPILYLIFNDFWASSIWCN